MIKENNLLRPFLQILKKVSFEERLEIAAHLQTLQPLSEDMQKACVYYNWDTRPEPPENKALRNQAYDRNLQKNHVVYFIYKALTGHPCFLADDSVLMNINKNVLCFVNASALDKKLFLQNVRKKQLTDLINHWHQSKLCQALLCHKTREKVNY